MIPYELNLLDLAFTLYALDHGGVELNPFMQNLSFMVVYKVIVVGVALAWLGNREEHIARLGRYIITVAYAAVNLWHIVNLAALVVV